MKKMIAMAFCFALAVSALTGCGGNEDKKTTDTTTKRSTVATEPSTQNTTPTTQATQPSTIPDSGYMPDGNTNGDIGNSGNGSTNGGNSGADNANGGTGLGGTMNNGSDQSRSHAPSIGGRIR